MNLKVQMPGKLTAAALMNSSLGFNEGKCFTFHAFSEKMKARVLEQIALGQNIIVRETMEAPKTSEWMEEKMV